MESWSLEEVGAWLSSENSLKGGRPRFFASQSLTVVHYKHKYTSTLMTIRDERVHKIEDEAMVPFAARVVSTATVSRTLHRQNWTRKVLSRRNIRTDPFQQAEYLEKIPFVDPNL